MEKFYLYNTLTKRVDEFVPREAGKVSMYTCGPTVYHFAHIGNLRSYIMEDVLEKFLRYIGYDVKRVMNITDVGHLSSDGDTGEDKMVSGAKREGKTVMELAKFYENAFFDDCRKLNIKTPDVVEPATNCIAEYIKLIEKLFENGYAYEAGGNIYFDTSKLKDYYQLTGHSSDDLLVGVRSDVEEDGNKRNKSDFVLWFTKSKFDSQELKWDSPWGVGYPGWHIECSAMNWRYLGDTIDIHCGGQDLIFPHHENEIAQSECFTGKPFAHYWMHNGYINVDNVKMSKSLGNFFTVRDVAEKYGYEPIRYLLISAQYRSPINYSTDIIEQCISALNRLYTCRDSLDFELKNAVDAEHDGDKAIIDGFDKYREQFISAMDDDLNTADAIASIFELVRDINTNVVGKTPSKALVEGAIAMFDELTGVLGLVYNRKTETLDSDVEALIEARTNARKEKNWAEADRIRDQLKEMGIVLEDTAQGVKWHRE